MTQVHSPEELVGKLSQGNTVLMNEAEWCGYCQQHKPEFVRQSKMHKDTQFLVFDMDANRSKMTGRYRALSDAVSSYPTILGFRKMKDGSIKAYKSSTGARDDATTEKMVKMLQS